MPSSGERLIALIRADPPDRAAIASYLDTLSRSDRLEAVRALSGPKLQARLYRAVESAPRVSLADFVPPDAPPLREFIFEGKNSLAAFTIFQKRFCRPPRGDAELWGYNHQSLAWLTGPGYFVVHDDGGRGAAIDYRVVPPEKPASWPDVYPNDRGFSRFVYRGTVDYMRRVSREVFIGSAHRGGKELGNYFVLCRDS